MIRRIRSARHQAAKTKDFPVRVSRGVRDSDLFPYHLFQSFRTRLNARVKCHVNSSRKESGLWSKDFLFVILINFLIFVNHVMTLSTFPFYIQSLGGSEALAGLTATLFSLIAVIFRPFIGLSLNRGKRKILLLIGIVGMNWRYPYEPREIYPRGNGTTRSEPLYR